MSEGRITEAELLSGLHPLRLPETGAGGWIADLFAAIGLALLLGLLVLLALRLVSTRRRYPAAKVPLSDRIAAAKEMPDDDARLALYRLMQERSPASVKRFQSALFDPNEPFDFDMAEKIILGADQGHA